MIAYDVAAASDVAALAALRSAGEAGGASAERMARYLAGTHHPQQALKPRVIYMASAEARPIGYVAGHLTKRYGCDGELQWIYVAPDYRGSGVAAELLRLLAVWFSEHDAARVCVDVGDVSGRRFYEKFGAEPLNEHWMVWTDIGAVLRSGPPPLKQPLEG